MKTIGFEAVPSANNLPPLAIIRTEARDPVPEVPLMIVPGSIVSVIPSGITTLLLIIYIQSLSHVSLDSIHPYLLMVQTSKTPPSMIGAVAQSSCKQLKNKIGKKENFKIMFFILVVVNFFTKLHSIATIID